MIAISEFEDYKFVHDYVTINDEDEALDHKAMWSYLFGQAVRKMVDEIMAQEDAEIFKVLDSIAESGNKDI